MLASVSGLQRASFRPFQAGASSTRATTSVCAQKVSLSLLVRDLEKAQLKPAPPAIRVGDTVKIGIAVVETLAAATTGAPTGKSAGTAERKFRTQVGMEKGKRWRG